MSDAVRPTRMADAVYLGIRLHRGWKSTHPLPNPDADPRRRDTQTLAEQEPDSQGRDHHRRDTDGGPAPGDAAPHRTRLLLVGPTDRRDDVHAAHLEGRDDTVRRLPVTRSMIWSVISMS